jgi:hypothetical protein
MQDYTKERTIKQENYIQLPGGKWFDKANAIVWVEWDAGNQRKSAIYKVGSTAVFVGHIWRGCSDERDPGSSTQWVQEWREIPHQELGQYAVRLKEIPVRFLDQTKEIK